MGHARLSPSAGHRWVSCPGSVRKEAAYPNESNKYAADGTHSHTLLEASVHLMNCQDRKRIDVFSNFNGKTLEDVEGIFEVDKARCNRVQVAVDYVAEMVKEFDCYIQTESGTESFPAFHRFDMSGTLDILLHRDYYFEVVDYKDGVGYVSPKENKQLIIYALSSLKVAHPQAYGRVKEIKLTIIQPKNVMKGREPIQSWSFPVSEVENWLNYFKEKASATDKPDAPLIAGSHCDFCKHRAFCEERRKFVMNKADLQEVKIFPDLVDQTGSKDPMTLDDSKLKEIMDAAPLIRGFLDDVAKELFKRTESGKSTGYKIVAGRGSRSWARSEEEIIEAMKKMGVPKDSVYEPKKLLSPAKVEKLSWTKKSKGEEVQKTLSKRQLETLQREYVSHVAGKPTLALEDDPRPSIKQDAESLFSAVESPKKEESLPTWLIGGN